MLLMRSIYSKMLVIADFWAIFSTHLLILNRKKKRGGNFFQKSTMAGLGYAFVQIKSSRRRIVNISSQKKSRPLRSEVLKHLETAV